MVEAPINKINIDLKFGESFISIESAKITAAQTSALIICVDFIIDNGLFL
jgi:hypothetical protein